MVNPRSLIGQLNGGVCLGIAHALHQKLVYDPHYGLSLARRFHHNKPITILDVPAKMRAVALDIADPETPVGARGVGEPPVGAGFGAVLNAIADAIGVDAFRRAPVSADIVLMSLTHGRRMHEPLQAHIVVASSAYYLTVTLHARSFNELGIVRRELELVDAGRGERGFGARRAGNREVHRARSLQQLPLDDKGLAARQAFVLHAAKQIQFFVERHIQRRRRTVRPHGDAKHAHRGRAIEAHAFRHLRIIDLRQRRRAFDRFQFDCSMRSLVPVVMPA